MSGSRKQRELCPVLIPVNKHKCTKAPVRVRVRVSRYVHACDFTEDTHAGLVYGYANLYVHYMHREQVDVRERLFFTATWNCLKQSFAFSKLLCFKYNLSSRTAHSSLKLSPAPMQHRFAAARACLPLKGYPCCPHPLSLVRAYTSTPAS